MSIFLSAHYNANKRSNKFFPLPFYTLLFISILIPGWLVEHSYADEVNAYEGLAIEFEDAINNNNIEQFSKIIDVDALIMRMENSVSKEGKEFVDALTKDRDAFLGAAFGSLFQQGIDAFYLRLIEKDKPFVRIVLPEGGYEYLILKTGVGDSGKLVIVDIYRLSTGRDLSVTLGLFSQLFSAPNESMLRHVFGNDNFDIGLLDLFHEVALLKRKGKHKQAYKIFQKLPENIRKNRLLIDVAIQLASMVGQDEYQKQLSLLDKYYGSDLSASFILIDHHLYTEKYDKAETSVDRLIKEFGTDAGLLNLKASIYHSKNDFDGAKSYALSALKLEPYFEGSYWLLASMYTDEKKYIELVELFMGMELAYEFSFTKDEFVSDEYYSEFIQSKEFSSWIN